MSDDDREAGLSQHPEAVRARERRREGKGSKPKRQAPSGGEIRTRLRESLASLAEALEDRDPELARIFRRDGPKMADLLGKWGEHPKAPPPLKVAVVVLAELLEPVRAFGALTRELLRRLRERRLAAVEPELDVEPEPWSHPLQPEPEPELVVERRTPGRFDADFDAEREFGEP